MGSTHQIVIEDLRQIFAGSTFLYDKEHELSNILSEAFAEMAFVVHCFKASHAHLLSHGTPELQAYIDELNELKTPPSSNIVIELHAFDLSTYFKSFLLLAKGTLDKVVPLYSYRFYDNLQQFSDKGTRLIRRIKKNKNVPNKQEFILLIEEAKSAWIDNLVALRDEYAHYSSLKEYMIFWLPGEWIGQKKFVGISDFYRPTLILTEKTVDALEYVLSIKKDLVKFLIEFLQLCDFNSDRWAKTYLQCEGCGHVFAKRIRGAARRSQIIMTSPNIKIEIKDRPRDYGVIVCPKSSAKTDTDLQFWKNEGFSFFPSESYSEIAR